MREEERERQGISEGMEYCYGGRDEKRRVGGKEGGREQFVRGCMCLDICICVKRVVVCVMCVVF